MRYLSVLLFVAAVAEAGPVQKPAPALPSGAQFHLETSFDDRGIRSSRVHFGDSLPLYKTYEGVRTVRLAEAPLVHADFASTLRARRSTRRFSSDSLDFAELSRLLAVACAVTGQRGGIARRPAPSAGALYPIEVYLIARHVAGLAPGLYHFRPRDSVLEFMRPGDLGEFFLHAANDQGAASDCPAALLMAARFDRSTHKYGDRGYRYAYMEAGAICQNLYLAATALGMGTVAIGAFNDEAANTLVGLDGIAEAVLLLMPLGYPAEP